MNRKRSCNLIYYSYRNKNRREARAPRTLKEYILRKKNVAKLRFSGDFDSLSYSRAHKHTHISCTSKHWARLPQRLCVSAVRVLILIYLLIFFSHLQCCSTRYSRVIVAAKTLSAVVVVACCCWYYRMTLLYSLWLYSCYYIFYYCLRCGHICWRYTSQNNICRALLDANWANFIANNNKCGGTLRQLHSLVANGAIWRRGSAQRKSALWHIRLATAARFNGNWWLR